MKKKESNFKKAVNDLLSFEGNGSDTEAETQNDAGTVSEHTEGEGMQTGESREEYFPGEPVSQPPIFYEGNSGISDSHSKLEKPVYEAVITPDVIINGNIIAGSNLKVLGKIMGSVECGGNIVLSGSIEGDVSANRLRFVEGDIRGNVSVREDIAAEKGTSVTGDVSAKSAVLGGNMQGDLTVHDNLELRETSTVLGNIKARGISIYNGSRIRGTLDIGGEIEEMGRENEE